MINEKFEFNYAKKAAENPFPPLPEDERIYLNVAYTKRALARIAHCSFDRVKKLWFTGSMNLCLRSLVEIYGVNEATSEKALKLLEEKLKEEE